MAYITLSEGSQRYGEFDLPASITGVGGLTFRLGYAVRGGGNGVVFDSRVSGGGPTVPNTCAVKVLRQQDQTRIDRFANEARILGALSHDRVSALFDKGEIDLGSGFIVPWVAMELGGSNLRDHVRQYGPLPLGQLKIVGADACAAIAHIHEREIVHRDIKPDNFVWDRDAPDRVKMIDFGIAKYVGEDVSARPLDEFTKQMEFVGPVFFSSPELIAYATNKAHPVTTRSDLFQLGKLLWFLGTGNISAGIPSRKLCPANGRLRDLVLALVEDDPDERLGSANDVCECIAGL